MQINKRTFEIPGRNDSVIRGDLRFIFGETDLPTIIFCHGFKGFKDWGFFPFMSEVLATRGYGVVNFNFSHNGVGADLLEFTELERFKANTYALEEEDFDQVIAALATPQLNDGGVFCTDKIGVVGHSRGGACVLCSAGRHPGVKAVATLASIASLGQVHPSLEEEWRTTGVRYIQNLRTGQDMPLGVALLDEILANQDKIEAAVRALDLPLLIIHGEADAAVPVSAAESLHEWAPDSELYKIEGADHVFGARHPFKGSTKCLDRVLQLIDEFFKQHLQG